METTREWRIFPIGTSNFGYNETVAQEYSADKENCEKCFCLGGTSYQHIRQGNN